MRTCNRPGFGRRSRTPQCPAGRWCVQSQAPLNQAVHYPLFTQKKIWASRFFIEFKWISWMDLREDFPQVCWVHQIVFVSFQRQMDDVPHHSRLVQYSCRKNPWSVLLSLSQSEQFKFGATSDNSLDGVLHFGILDGSRLGEARIIIIGWLLMQM